MINKKNIKFHLYYDCDKRGRKNLCLSLYRWNPKSGEWIGKQHIRRLTINDQAYKMPTATARRFLNFSSWIYKVTEGCNDHEYLNSEGDILHIESDLINCKFQLAYIKVDQTRPKEKVKRLGLRDLKQEIEREIF